MDVFVFVPCYLCMNPLSPPPSYIHQQQQQEQEQSYCFRCTLYTVHCTLYSQRRKYCTLQNHYSLCSFHLSSYISLCFSHLLIYNSFSFSHLPPYIFFPSSLLQYLPVSPFVRPTLKPTVLSVLPTFLPFFFNLHSASLLPAFLFQHPSVLPLSYL